MYYSNNDAKGKDDILSNNSDGKVVLVSPFAEYGEETNISFAKKEDLSPHIRPGSQQVVERTSHIEEKKEAQLRITYTTPR